MSRALVGFAGVHAVFVAVGLAVLYALGLVNRPRQALVAIGPAYLSGLACLMPVLCLLLVLDVPVRLPQFLAAAVALGAALAVAGMVLGRRGRSDATPPPREPNGQTWLSRAGVAALALYFAVGASAFAKLPTGNDDWGFWSYKALALFHLDGRLQPDLFQGRFPGPAHLDYPILQPLLESVFFRAMGGEYLQEWHIALWIVFAAFVWTVWFLFRSRGVDGLLVLAPLAALALAPTAAAWPAAGEADVTVACFAAAGAVAVALWLDGGPTGYAVLGGLFLGAAANTKNEGLVAAVAVVLVACAIVLVTRDPRRRAAGALASVVVASAAPWQLWRSAHELSNEDVPPILDALDWGYLTGRLDRLSAAIGNLAGLLADRGAWVWLVPCFLALAIVCLIARTARRQAAFYLAVGMLMLAALWWAAWTGTEPVDEWLARSGPRYVTGIVFVAGVGVIHLVHRLLRDGRERGGQSDSSFPTASGTPVRADG